MTRIRVLRGARTLLDADLAELYGVPTKRFNEQVRRNLARFPPDFMFQLTSDEFAAMRSQCQTSNSDLRSQSATSNPNLKSQKSSGGRRHLPYAFTEHGAIMAATILNSSQATDVCVYVVRAFVQFRQALESQKDFAQALAVLEARLDLLAHRHDALEGQTQSQIAQILDALHSLSPPAEATSSRPIGFVYPAP
jgi:hypothetical protein